MPCSYCRQIGHNIRTCPIAEQEILNSIQSTNDVLQNDIEELLLAEDIEELLLPDDIENISDLETDDEMPELISDDDIVSENVENKEGDTGEKNTKVFESEECSLCLNTLGNCNKCITQCGHMFCLSCLVTASKYKDECPLCRSSLKLNNINEKQNTADVQNSMAHLSSILLRTSRGNNNGDSLTDLLMDSISPRGELIDLTNEEHLNRFEDRLIRLVIGVANRL